MIRRMRLYFKVGREKLHFLWCTSLRIDFAAYNSSETDIDVYVKSSKWTKYVFNVLNYYFESILTRIEFIRYI